MESWRCDAVESTGKCGGSPASTMAAAREHRKRRRQYSSDPSTTTVAVMMTIMLVLSITAVGGTRHRDVGDHKLHHQTYDVAKVRSDPLLLERERWLRQSAAISRILDENNEGDEAAAQEDDVADADDNIDYANNDDGYSTPSPTPSELSALTNEHAFRTLQLTPQCEQPMMITRQKSRACVRISPALSTSSAQSISLASYRARLTPTTVARE